MSNFKTPPPPPRLWPGAKRAQITMSAEEYSAGLEPGHAKSPQNQLRGLANRAAGLAFEARVKAACEHYTLAKQAVVRKAEEPMKPIQRLADNRFIAVYTGKAEADYKGTLRGGRTIAFEAKHTEGDRILQSVVTEAQREALTLQDEMGALCFVLAGLGGGKHFMVPWAVWQGMKGLYGRKYMTAAELAPYAVPLRMCRTEKKGMQPGVMFLHRMGRGATDEKREV